MVLEKGLYNAFCTPQGCFWHKATFCYLAYLRAVWRQVVCNKEMCKKDMYSLPKLIVVLL